MGAVPTFPSSTKTSLQQRLSTHAADRWPALSEVKVRFRGAFAYVDGVVTQDHDDDCEQEVLPLCRLRYTESAHDWGFAIYRASHDDYQDSFLPTGLPFGSCQDALDTACGLYLGDPTAWS